MMAHNVMPTNFKLSIHGSGKDSYCIFERFVENPKRSFPECHQAAPVCLFYFFAKSVFWKNV